MLSDLQQELTMTKRKLSFRKQNLLGRTSPREVDFAVLSTQRLRKEPVNTVLRGACAVQTSSRAQARPWPKRLLQSGHGQCLAEAVIKTTCVSVSVCLCGSVSVSLLVNMSKHPC